MNDYKQNKRLMMKLVPEIRKLLTCRKVIPMRCTPNRDLTFGECEVLSRNIKTEHHGVYNTTTFDGYPIHWTDVKIASKEPRVIEGVLVHKIAKLDDSIIINYLINSAVNMTTYSRDFGTNENATYAVADALCLMEADEYNLNFGSNLLLNEEQFQQLCRSFGKCGLFEFDTIKGLLHGGSVWCTEIEAGKGLLLPSMEHTNNFINVYIDWDVVEITDNVYRVYASFELVTPEYFNMICRIENI